MTPKVVAGQDTIKTDTQEIVQILEQKLEEIKSGELKVNRMLLMLVNNDVDAFDHRQVRFGRALEIAGLLEVSKVALLKDMNIL